MMRLEPQSIISFLFGHISNLAESGLAVAVPPDILVDCHTP